MCRDIYREAGRKSAPTLILLHGYPTSFHMYRNLIRELLDDYHLIAPDYPGYGKSEQPAIANFSFFRVGGTGFRSYL